MTILRLGTRKSLLAWTQSSHVAASLETAHEGLQVELVGIVTQGDRILDKPLSQIEGKEFFVKEIDDALRRGEVDLTVHSMKDLSIERPDWTILGAIPQRQLPHDVLIGSPLIMERLAAGQTVTIGTSSPRRLQNLASLLPDILPYEPQVEFREIRGNVNTRLERLHADASSSQYLDAVILAAAGLNRLALDKEAGETLKGLMRSCPAMMLPLSQCPTSPAQGALAIECRRDDEKTQAYLRAIHHQPSADLVAEERELMAEWGGGCHQKFGITAVAIDGLDGRLLFKRGIRADGSHVDGIDWKTPSESVGEAPLSGKKIRGSAAESASSADELTVEACFVANDRAVTSESIENQLRGIHVWVPGLATWRKLAKRGIWVEGSSDGFGRAHLEELIRISCFDLPDWRDWGVLTHEDAKESWQGHANVLATYKVDYSLDKDVIELCRGATDVFWTSGSQYQAYSRYLSENVRHACGPGATRAALVRVGVDPIVFPSHDHWEQWASQRG